MHEGLATRKPPQWRFEPILSMLPAKHSIHSTIVSHNIGVSLDCSQFGGGSGCDSVSILSIYVQSKLLQCHFLLQAKQMKVVAGGFQVST